MKNYLVLTALGEKNFPLTTQFTQAIRDAGCNIEDSRITSLGNEFSIVMMLSGNWDAIAKIEGTLPKLQDQLGLTITAKRTELAGNQNNQMPYAIDVVAFDRTGIVHDIAKFLTENNISIQNMETNTYKAVNTGAAMFSMHMTVNIPADISIASIRGDFIEFCDQLNLDAIMEPLK